MTMAMRQGRRWREFTIILNLGARRLGWQCAARSRRSDVVEVNREIAFYGFGAVARAVHKLAQGLPCKGL